jgi:flagellar biosynthesis protein FlhG
MVLGRRRLLKRSLSDVTSVRPEELRSDGVTASPQALGAVIPSIVPARSQVICIASGKGGTGKTVLATNLSVLLAREGLNVLLFDADLGLANSHLLLGVQPTGDISEVLSGQRRLADIVVECHHGLRLVPGGSGFSELAELGDRHFRYLAGRMRELEDSTDIVLVDLSAGISPQVMRFLVASHEIVLVTTPDITALIDAYAVIKSLAKVRTDVRVRLLFNQVRKDTDVRSAYGKLKRIVNKHLGEAQVSLFGWLPHNWYVHDSVVRRRPVALLHPMCLVTRRLQEMACRIRWGHGRWRADQMVPGRRQPSFFAQLEQMVF